ncbi:hypothetical protein L7F22_020612 [Adiantum nelumboides]|nr:hypothetical protein [Adiantum nelumboides]
MENDTYIGVVLLEMYVRCEAIEDAHSLFFSLYVRSTFSWNLIIRSYTSLRHDAEAILCLHQILAEASLADKFTYVSLLSSCVNLADLGETRRIHSCILSQLHQSDIIVRNALINAYTKCGSINEARIIFDMMSERDSFSWDTLIGAYMQHKLHHEALFLFYQQQHQGVLPTRITYVSILDSCASQGITGETIQIFSRISGSEFKGNAIVQAAMLYIFGQVGSKECAWRLFSEMSERDSFAWNVVLASHPGCKGTIELYSRMLEEGMLPGEETFIRVISLCTDPTTIALGKYMHACYIHSPINFRVAVGNAFISMYSRCAGLKDACRVFDSIPERNIVTWTTIVGAYVAHGQAMVAIRLFDQTLGEGLLFDKIMLISILNACASLRSPARIKRLHARIVGTGLDSDVEVGSRLASLYGKCGALKAAERMFDIISDRSTLLWTAMVCAYVEHNRPFYALQVFQQMKQEGILPNEVTFLGVLDACTKLSALGEGRRFHAPLASSVFDEISIKTALIKMYGRCGSLEESQRVFDDASEHDIVLLTAMMANYTRSGKVKQALYLFDKALQRGLKPDEVAYINVLSMCSHAGLLQEGRRYFLSMSHNYNVKPTVDHYSCMIVLYGRAGCIREAEDFITNMPFRATALQWMTLLSACRRQLDVERGERAARQVMLLEPKDPAPYVELFNIYSALGKEAQAVALLSKLKHLNDMNSTSLVW